MIEKPERVRDKRHLRHVAKYPCAIDISVGRAGKRIQGNLPCDPDTVVPHHLTHAQPKARGLKAGDQWTVPLCHKHHTELHAFGDESLWWALRGVDPIALARQLWQETLDFRAGTEAVEPDVKPLKSRGRNLIG